MPRSNHEKRDQRCHQGGGRHQGGHRHHRNEEGGYRNQGGHHKRDDDDRRRNFWRYDSSSSEESNRNQRDRNQRDQNQRDRNQRDQNQRDQNQRDQNQRDRNPRDRNPRDRNPRDQSNNVRNYLSPPETPDIPKGEIFHGQLLGMNNPQSAINNPVDNAVNNAAVVPRNSSVVNGATGAGPSSGAAPISILDDLHGQVAADYVDRFDGRRLHPDETRGCVGRPCCFDCQDICTRPFIRPCILDGYCDPCSGALINKYDTFPFKYRLCPPRRCC